MMAGDIAGVMENNGTETVFNNNSKDQDFRVESDNDENALFVQGSDGNVGIGIGSPGRSLTLFGNDQPVFQITNNTSGSASGRGLIQYINDGGTNAIFDNQGSGSGGIFQFMQAGTERVRLDANGNFMVKKTAVNFQTAGFQVEQSSGETVATRAGGTPLLANRLTNDGEVIGIYRGSTNIGGIKSNGGVTIDIDGGGDRVGLAFTGDSYLPRKNGSLSDDTNSIGDGSRRLDNIFATNSSINTSDKNEKQDIEELTDAEKRVAVVAKGLMRKYRWKSRVAQKGDKARTHFGIIAQDLQDAFTAESLDASKYAMFTSNTWWTKEITVDAVEAKDAVYKEVTDEDGGKTTELVSAEIIAKDAYTYIDTKQETTTGYTEKTRLGVRYNELLAFIISAI